MSGCRAVFPIAQLIPDCHIAQNYKHFGKQTPENEGGKKINAWNLVLLFLIDCVKWNRVSAWFGVCFRMFSFSLLGCLGEWCLSSTRWTWCHTVASVGGLCAVFTGQCCWSGSAGSTGHWDRAQVWASHFGECMETVLFPLPPCRTAYKLPFLNSDEVCDGKAWEAQQDWLKATGAGCLVLTQLE